MMELAVDCKNTLGECVLWCERGARLLWTDIAAATLWMHEPATGATRSWPMPERLASFALTEDDDRLLLGLASGLAFFRFSSGAVEPICDVEADLAGTRINDGRCDRQGRFVFGMFNQDSDPREAVGSFYRLNCDLSLERLPLGHVAIANSICFSPDGATMYFCDSQTKVIRSCDYGDVIGEQRVFADLSSEEGEPDGSTIDAEGCLWNARWGSGRLVRYTPDGQVARVLRLAAPQPTCVAFGGPLLDTVYATSARQWLSDAELAQWPASGGLFKFVTDVVGLAEQRFQG
ncbi:MAG: SMP-30/gluconolactonase/LRE family protein [Pseudomonadota bacterium]|nr:SMP-30/gluconolactonase/LRE family protein [Pseudomonadota bacterium]